mgnify:CR=1 FL=1
MIDWDDIDTVLLDMAVPYTHLKLPARDLMKQSVDPGQLKKK